MSRIHLRMCGYVVTLALHLTNGLYMRSFHTKELLEDPEIRTFVGVQWRYITTWTFLFQMVYALIGLTCDWLTLKNSSNKKYKVPSFLTNMRDTLYSGIIWPATFQVATLFWPFYLYNVQLVYPVFIDRVVTRLSNHIMHSFIVPIAVWEMFMRPQKKPPSKAKIVSVLVAYTVAYWVVVKVKIEGKNINSEAGMLDLGIPQGSALGNTLFLIFVNDLPTSVAEGMTVLFADDTTVVVKAHRIHSYSYVLELTSIGRFSEMTFGA
ncbi:uncharacterized protein LOC125238517 [Leguminivora glycinivorella]|uniref:uncharacterized protein LOC125238517 n=1 Tax=Leguminivora glycinivorella TaxID=1035111 RepID=UPI00200D3A59|nr:uncharacterized protein LOC125238517 [Leguminivora glycinivorella]